MSAFLNRNMRIKWLVVGVVILVVLVLSGFAISTLSKQSARGLVFGPIPHPVIQGGHVDLAFSDTICQSTPYLAVCPIYIYQGGEAGNVTLNVIDQDQQGGQGGSRAQFLVYSSDARFINFTSLPTCGYTSAPNYTSPSCPIGN